jgi:hypothetical protein
MLRAMVRRSIALSLSALVALASSPACSKKDEGANQPTSPVTKEAIERAKAKVHPPAPVADARAKFVEELGDPTATDGDDLIWAGVNGRECNEVRLVVQDGEANGFIGTSADKMIASEFDKCAAHAKAK